MFCFINLYIYKILIEEFQDIRIIVINSVYNYPHHYTKYKSNDANIDSSSLS